MAEAGAHLTSTAVNEQPSVFEVLAQESLMEAVKPALRHAVKVLAETNPSRFGFLWQRFDELYLLLDLLLQNHFLSHCSASFSENFYGLKRVSGGWGLSVGLGLHRKSHWRSLLLLCLVPYLRAKLEATLAQQRDEADFSIQLAQSRRQRLYRAAVAAYPYVRSAWQALSFCQQLLFIFGVARTHSPLLWLARVKLARLNAQDIRDMELKSSNTGYPADQSLVQKVWWLISRAARGVAIPLSTSLSLGVFFLQFLEWWYSSENQSTMKTLTSLPAPPPPLHLQEERSCSDSPSVSAKRREETQTGSDSRNCPLCRRLCTNTTVLSTSGFVFCYRCIYMYVKANHRCPVTGYPTELQHLIKIYTPES
ncbi:peroxisome assembly protein 12 [Seriola lalandi dorsalis]|uniref:peroxisome assembly protein 12 n=1 Tax=Seriola lalandi dorsalis TaxID=1841481 RepID=UPI000C6F6A10|nr:peroxisome assembly protein 12 [Seriola lalandi dorsalis]XP_023272105.1 peroxisome assembly protein 12 [Seriola lalandi dorsalis]XP_056257493.1 peroxisome assembly protein 12 [Seriola aureovittata]XP_056257494.1 peroxisome assembly protein 12 [Seriola aureovittata]